MYLTATQGVKVDGKSLQDHTKDFVYDGMIKTDDERDNLGVRNIVQSNLKKKGE